MRRYHNSTFVIREDAKRLRRGDKQMKRGVLLRSRKPMRKSGRRTRDWRKAWRFLKPELEKRGRTGCEFKFIPHECWGPIDPVHSRKRRLMIGNDIYMVAMGCRLIHEILDGSIAHPVLGRFDHAAMESAVLMAISLHGGPILPEGVCAVDGRH